MDEPVKKNMYKGVSLCYTIITLAYITIGITGYWAFGNAVQPFILANLTSPTWVITFANLLLIVQVVGCYQVSSTGCLKLLLTLHPAGSNCFAIHPDRKPGRKA